MKHLLLPLFVFALLSSVCGQKFNKYINKDSLLRSATKDLPEDVKNDLLKMYSEGDEQSKQLLLTMLSFPKSSLAELKSNLDKNIEKINRLNIAYRKLVPAGYTVSIEFNPANVVLSMPESIDLKIYSVKKSGIANITSSEVDQEWKLEYNSKKLSDMIKPLHWTNETLKQIKKLLSDANCVSIENGPVTNIGFARSGIGKYSFKLFPKDLTKEEMEHYSNSCSYIVYKNNIVLEYDAGAIGSSCFPDK